MAQIRDNLSTPHHILPLATTLLSKSDRDWVSLARSPFEHPQVWTKKMQNEAAWGEMLAAYADFNLKHTTRRVPLFEISEAPRRPRRCCVV